MLTIYYGNYWKIHFLLYVDVMPINVHTRLMIITYVCLSDYIIYVNNGCNIQWDNLIARTHAIFILHVIYGCHINIVSNFTRHTYYGWCWWRDYTAHSIVAYTTFSYYCTELLRRLL